MTSVFYATFYGSTRQYAEALAGRLGTVARELPATLDAAGGPVVVLSPVHGPSHPGVRFIKSLPAIDRPLALVTVGMTPVDAARHDDASGPLLGDRAGQVTRFYLPGRLNYSELTTAHRWMIKRWWARCGSRASAPKTNKRWWTATAGTRTVWTWHSLTRLWSGRNAPSSPVIAARRVALSFVWLIPLMC